MRLVSFVSSLEQTFNVDRELDCVTGWSRSEVVLARLQSLSPRVEMHCRHFLVHWVSQVQVQTLRLANVRSSTHSQVHKSLLGDLPDCFVNALGALWNIADVLDAAVVSNDLVFD